MATLNFNATEIEPSTGFDAIPQGKYIACISDSEMKSNRSGTGKYLQLEFTILEGEYKNRKLWSRLNLENPNADAVRMARADLSAICHAIGVLQPKDSVELHNLPLEITVKCRKNSDDEIVNDIKGYSARTTAIGATPQRTSKTNDSTATAASSTPPWARGK